MMNFFDAPHLYRRFFARRRRVAKRSDRNRPQLRPSLEVLEERCVPTVVTNLNDSGAGSLRDAIAAGGTVTFAPGLHGTINLTSGHLHIGSNVSINGPGAGVITVNGNKTDIVCDVDSGTQVSISGLTLTNGKGSEGGAIEENAANCVLTISNCVISGNTATSNGGGAISVSGNGAKLSLTGCTLNNNTSPFDGSSGGGAILTHGQNVTLTSCVLMNNSDGSADEGGGAIQTQGGNLIAVHCNISNNTAAGLQNAGGIGTEGGNVTLTDCTLNGNKGTNSSGDSEGGGAMNTEGGNVTVLRCTINNNIAAGQLDGGAILSEGGNVSVTDSSVSGNQATGTESGGGAINSEGGNVTVVRSTLNNNTTPGLEDGGAILSSGGNVSLTDSALIGNRATGTGGGPEGRTSEGGGAIETEGGNVIGVRSTISNNTTAGVEGGGGIATEGGDVTLTNSTLSGNTATFSGSVGNRRGGGGAIETEGADINLVNCTIFGNSTAGLTGGGGLDPKGDFRTQGTITLLNTIVAGNRATHGPGPDIAGIVASSSHSLIGDGSTTGLVNGKNGNLVGSTGHTINPLLGPLQINGGLTPTLALLAGSPAIDAGDDSVLGPPHNLTTDQRGAPRKVGLHVDIGAFEFVPQPPPPPPSPHGRRNGPV
jgi:hypothetical protein